MTKTSLAAALSLALLMIPVSHAAKYRVVELLVADKGQSIFPTAINDGGNITVNVSSAFNVPIDLELLDFESQALIDILTDVDAARNGNINSVDYEILLALIKSADGTQSAQQIASTVSFLASENETSFIPGFDQLSGPKNEFYFSTTNNVRDINNSGAIVGSGEGFYNKINYTFASGENANFVVHKVGTRAFFSLGNTTVGLPAPKTIAGGFSEAYGINENNQVVGYGTSSFISDDIETSITDCENEELIDDNDPDTVDFPSRGDIPVESCISGVVSTLSNSVAAFTQLRGLIWQLDAQGNLLETKELGLLYEPEEEDIANFSQAFGINDNGVAVGTSSRQYALSNGRQTISATQTWGVIFDEDEVINLTLSADDTVIRTNTENSSAVDINNNNLVVGHKYRSVNGKTRSKFFVYDMTLGEITFPDDFFLGSSSIATDINNNGLVVGYGEVDASLTGRRTEGFLYDTAADIFYGLRELVGCDSPYTIVQANSINDSDVIGATALYQGPARDSRGEILLDSSGNEAIVDLVTAVKLEPIIGGEVESCIAQADEINKERQGASVMWLLGFCFVLLGFRRFKSHF